MSNLSMKSAGKSQRPLSSPGPFGARRQPR